MNSLTFYIVLLLLVVVWFDAPVLRQKIGEAVNAYQATREASE